MRKLKLISCLVAVGLLSACVTYRVGDFTLVSTKNVNLSSNSLVRGERVTGIDKTTDVVYMKNAVDNAIEKNKCAVALSDAVIKFKNNFFTASYIAEGNLVIDRSLPGCGSK
ncbi:hypothetical protein [Haemophilus haemolyticus]|jgi:hypothetical protein|uniref:hypothetical protein n=1 Tax=Haemophilus haemolyticus TaxID=726 RepID=UPI0011265886|nr:hypothetical protein [Haemophilus haemolyticus]TPH10405.1 hypothetical protein EUX49_03740 [Haemophilus haemolyticus]